MFFGYLFTYCFKKINRKQILICSAGGENEEWQIPEGRTNKERKQEEDLYQ